MAAPDMEVIKEIPGYKVILKAVLKSQIQQLVEQLASHTEEETVVLTASISDGTLSHLGSASGKSFLDDHEEMKSQFLGFCLKKHHQKSSQKMQSPGYQNPSVIGYPTHPSQRGQIGTSRTNRIGRHEPYRRRRGQVVRQPSDTGLPATDQNPGESVMGTPDKSVVKTESEGVENESSNQSFSETVADSNVLDSSHLQQANSESTELNTVDSVTEPLADFVGEGTNADQSNELDPGAICDNSINVKQEAGLDSDLELQITGMEPARSQDNWGANMSMSDVSMDMSYDPIGATGSSLDMQTGQQGYNYTDEEMMTMQRNTCVGPDGKIVTYSTYRCNYCNKSFRNRGCVRRHFLSHTGAKEFRCDICLVLFARKDHMLRHVRSVHKEYFIPVTTNSIIPYDFKKT